MSLFLLLDNNICLVLFTVVPRDSGTCFLCWIWTMQLRFLHNVSHRHRRGTVINRWSAVDQDLSVVRAVNVFHSTTDTTLLWCAGSGYWSLVRDLTWPQAAISESLSRFHDAFYYRGGTFPLICFWIMGLPNPKSSEWQLYFEKWRFLYLGHGNIRRDEIWFALESVFWGSMELLEWGASESLGGTSYRRTPLMLVLV